MCRPRKYLTLGLVVLAAATLLAHGWSLSDGSVLDDHWHQKGLREHGWSYSELMRTLTIEPAQWLEHWWQDRTVRFEYGRPLFILAMKFVYVVLGGENPIALHAFSILLHLISACLVWRLAWLLTRHRFWSLLASLLFVVYQHAQVTVAWPSSQNIVIATPLILAALLMYLRASRLDPLTERAAGFSEPPTSVGAVEPRGLRPAARHRPAPQSLRVRWVASAVVVWVIALFVRENALIVPVMAVAFDLAFGGRRQVWARWPAYAAFALVGLAFLIWRTYAVTTPMPDVYVRWPDGDYVGYGLWCAAKLLHYLCTSLWLAPMMVGPTGRLHPWTEVPGDCVLMLAIVGAIFAGYLFVTRGVRGRWLWPLWIVLAVLPVIPVIATPHSGYLSGVGFAIGAVLGPALGRSRAVRAVGATAACFSLLGMSVFTVLSRWQWTGTIAAERYTLAWVESAPPPPEATDVFFINLPFVNIYVAPALEHELGASYAGKRSHVLTYAPDPFLVDARTYVVQQDDYSFSVQIEGQPYFSRLLGRFLIEAFRSEGPFREGKVVHGPAFDVRIDAVEPQGVRRLTFTFPHPLNDPCYCFYVTTWNCGAARLRFACADAHQPAFPEAADALTPDAVRDAAARLLSGDADAGRTLFAALRGPETIARPARRTLRAVASTLAEALACPVQNLLAWESPSQEDWRTVWRWWVATVDDHTLRELWSRRHRNDHFLKQREEIPHARAWAAQVIRTDLYLTGPPFPGPDWPATEN